MYTRADLLKSDPVELKYEPRGFMIAAVLWFIGVEEEQQIGGAQHGFYTGKDYRRDFGYPRVVT